MNTDKTWYGSTALDLNDIKDLQDYDSDLVDDWEKDYEMIYEQLVPLSAEIKSRSLRFLIINLLDTLAAQLKMIHELRSYKALVDLGFDKDNYASHKKS